MEHGWELRGWYNHLQIDGISLLESLAFQGVGTQIATHQKTATCFDSLAFHPWFVDHSTKTTSVSGSDDDYPNTPSGPPTPIVVRAFGQAVVLEKWSEFEACPAETHKQLDKIKNIGANEKASSAEEAWFQKTFPIPKHMAVWTWGLI